ncbi:hypothetical protein INR49_028819 [Caranx melampygus]|nr:hypothetical protein INR49_028819 [Caranx melampygus]
MVKLRARCLLVGDAAVGKSALSHMFHSDGTLFQKTYSMTTGVELLMKCVNIPETSDSVELYIIDSAGKETLVEACEKMWGEPSLLCLVFDLTSEQSFANCSRWMERVRAHCRGLHVPGVLVGNKSDLSTRREVQTSVARSGPRARGWSTMRHQLGEIVDVDQSSITPVSREMENRDALLLSLARSFHTLYQERRETIQNLNPG